MKLTALWRQPYKTLCHMLVAWVVFDKLVTWHHHAQISAFIDKDAQDFVRHQQGTIMDIRGSFWTIWLKNKGTIYIKDPKNPTCLLSFSPSKRYQVIPVYDNTQTDDIPPDPSRFVVIDAETGRIVFQKYFDSQWCKLIDLDTPFWNNHPKNKETRSIKKPKDNDQPRCFSPPTRYQVISVYESHVKDNLSVQTGFKVRDTQTGRIVFQANNGWYFADYWLFNERYVGYFVERPGFLDPSIWFYLGNLSSGKSVAVCKGKY